MEDELEDRVLYQTYLSFTKLFSRITGSVPLDSPVSYFWKMVRLYVLRSEVVVFIFGVVLFFIYLQNIELWSRTLLSRLSQAMSPLSAVQRMKLMESHDDKQSWELKGVHSAAYAIKGRRMHMEDRFIISEDINNTGVSLFAIFDGHGGDFAANYARDHLIQNLHNKIVELNNFKDGKVVSLPKDSPEDISPKDPEPSATVERKISFKKSASTADDSLKKEVTDPELLAQILKARPIITREVRPNPKPVKNVQVPLTSYLKKGKIDYGKLLTDEVLAADRLLVEAAKRSMNVAGTTALIAIMEEGNLIVANVGDSRGVMCDSRGNAIPVSFDHKPQQVREQKRIEAAGGYIAFNGVWRVAGILATSRAMGDYPLKDKRFVIADPDILSFQLGDHKPAFLLLASDGLWDTFTNEEAVKFIKERLDEPDFGAKSLTLQAYYRGSVDNITVLVLNFSSCNTKAAQND